MTKRKVRNVIAVLVIALAGALLPPKVAQLVRTLASEYTVIQTDELR